MSDTTKPEVFIIESLRLQDEEAERFEGRRIASMLHLSDKKCKYVYLRTLRELKEILQVFRESEYRYLHLSCHGNAKGLSTTFDWLTIPEIGKMLNPFLSQRRVFLSACETMTMPLASTLLTTTGCYSIMGPYSDIEFGDAATFWATFYHLMFKKNKKAMQLQTISDIGQAASKLFKVRMKLFSKKDGKIDCRILR